MNTAEHARPGQQMPGSAVLPFFVLTSGLAWGIFATLIFLADLATAFGGIIGSHPLFSLAVYTPIVAVIVAWLNRATMFSRAEVVTTVLGQAPTEPVCSMPRADAN